MKIESRTISGVRRATKPPAPKSAEDIEFEFTDSFLASAEDVTRKELRPSFETLRKSELSASTAAFLAVGSALAPAQALAMAGRAFATTQPELASTIDSRYAEGRSLIQELDSGTPLYSHSEVPAALTTGTSVYINPEFVPHLNTPVTDWVVGHELGHVESQDGLAAIGRSFVIGQLKADGMEDKLVSGLEGLHHALNRECEFEADREGLDYALAKGHSRESILASLGGFLSAMPAGYEESHPDPTERIKRLRQY